MKFWTADRQTGKTTAAVRWAAADPERRAVLVATHREARSARDVAVHAVRDPDVAARVRVLTVREITEARGVRYSGIEFWVDEPSRVMSVWLDLTGGLLIAAAQTVDGDLSDAAVDTTRAGT